MIYVGIDPGLDGAIGAIGGALAIPTVWDTPVIAVQRGAKTRREFDVAGVTRLLRQIQYMRGSNGEVKAAIERVHAMPKAGAVGMFSFGCGYGVWQGALAALGIPYDLVEPARWKKVMMDGMAKEKAAACFRAQQLWPDIAFTGPNGGPLHGRADALLIAEYRRRIG